MEKLIITSSNNTFKSDKPEKERLELIEKRVDIQLKLLEMRLDKTRIDENIKDIVYKEDKMLIEKISELRYLLKDVTVDEERTIMASEPFIMRSLPEIERNVVMKKLIELVKKL